MNNATNYKLSFDEFVKAYNSHLTHGQVTKVRLRSQSSGRLGPWMVAMPEIDRPGFIRAMNFDTENYRIVDPSEIGDMKMGRMLK